MSVPPSSRQVGGSHYQNFEIEPIKFCQVNRLNNCESSAIGYICRHPYKGGISDLQKAIHCLEMALEFEYGVETREQIHPPREQICSVCSLPMEDA